MWRRLHSLLKRSLLRSWFLLPFAVALLLVSTRVWKPQFLIVPPQLTGFVDNTEFVLPILLAAVCSFILPDPYEVELGLVCGVRTTKLAFSKFIPILLYSLISIFIMLIFYRYKPYDLTLYNLHIPIFVPENYKIYLAVSFFVTILFFTSLYYFIRVLTRNCYIPIIICLFLQFVLYNQYIEIKKGSSDIKYCLVDPFISGYILSDELPNAFAEQFTDLKYLHNAWTYNRILFFVLSLVLLGAAYLLLRREKLHKGFGD